MACAILGFVLTEHQSFELHTCPTTELRTGFSVVFQDGLGTGGLGDRIYGIGGSIFGGALPYCHV